MLAVTKVRAQSELSRSTSACVRGAEQILMTAFGLQESVSPRMCLTRDHVQRTAVVAVCASRIAKLERYAFYGIVSRRSFRIVLYLSSFYFSAHYEMTSQA